MVEIEHNCGICLTHTLHDNYNFIKSLQHRGREVTGMAAIGNDRIDVIKWRGNTSQFDIVDLHKIFPSDQYHTYIAHDRYPTKGKKEDMLTTGHPHSFGGKIEYRDSHIVIRDCDMAMIHNGQVDVNQMGNINRTNLKTSCDTEALLQLYRENGVHGLMNRISGAFTLVIADKRMKETVVLRDRLGMKPGVLGLKDGKYCVASEDIAINENGGNFIEDISPGSAYYFNAQGGIRKEQIIKPQKTQHCFFEWNYISHLDSTLDNVGVRTLRRNLGQILADEFNPGDLDLVTFLPRCPETAARSYSQKLNLPFQSVFYKMKSERSFQGSNQNDRSSSIKNNLYLIPDIQKVIGGKTVLVIDDSTIRGTNAARAKELLEVAGVKKIYLANYTPKIGIIGKDNVQRGCMFGVDMPPNDNFIARGRTDREISEAIGMETFFLSVNGLKKAFEKSGMAAQDLCTFCVGGKHPIN